MRILSVHAGKPKTFGMGGGDSFETSIFKKQVQGRVWVKNDAVDGDYPADREFHGGTYKAVYTYASEFYPFWKQELGKEDIPFGMFGENLTTEGFDETDVWIGDRYRMGEALLEAVSPRIPCETLGFRFKDQGIVKRFMQAQKMGIYFRIIEEGQLGAGEEIRLEKKRKDTARVLELSAVYASNETDKSRVQELLKIEELPPDMRAHLTQRLG